MKITKWNYTLTHETYMNMGILCDRIEVESNWIIYPILPQPVVRDYPPTKNRLDSTMWYTDSELTEILEEFIQELNK